LGFLFFLGFNLEAPLVQLYIGERRTTFANRAIFTHMVPSSLVIFVSICNKGQSHYMIDDPLINGFVYILDANTIQGKEKKRIGNPFIIY
jgi:hypothetical protein